jgi:hypothetical protein
MSKVAISGAVQLVPALTSVNMPKLVVAELSKKHGSHLKTG